MQYGGLDDIDLFITDTGLADAQLAELRKAGVTVDRA